MENKERKPYGIPAVRIVVCRMEQALCGSPQKGGNEDVGYDNWWVE
jgi:hypothetical protein